MSSPPLGSLLPNPSVPIMTDDASATTRFSGQRTNVSMLRTDGFTESRPSAAGWCHGYVVALPICPSLSLLCYCRSDDISAVICLPETPDTRQPYSNPKVDKLVGSWSAGATRRTARDLHRGAVGRLDRQSRHWDGRVIGLHRGRRISLDLVALPHRRFAHAFAHARDTTGRTGADGSAPVGQPPGSQMPRSGSVFPGQRPHEPWRRLPTFNPAGRVRDPGGPLCFACSEATYAHRWPPRRSVRTSHAHLDNPRRELGPGRRQEDDAAIGDQA